MKVAPLPLNPPTEVPRRSRVGILMKIGMIVWVSLLTGIAGAESIPLKYDYKVGKFTFPAIVNGRTLTASINLSLLDSYVSTKALGYQEVSIPKVAVRVKTLGLSEQQVNCRTNLSNDLDMYLGRSFFKDKVLNWDIARQILTVEVPPPGEASKANLDFEKGIFSFGGSVARLPMLSPVTALPKGTLLELANDINSVRNKMPIASNSKYAMANYKGTLQSVIAAEGFGEFGKRPPELSQDFVPGASFFGAQTVQIDFVKSEIKFEANPKLNGIYLLSQKIALRLHIGVHGLCLTGSSDEAFDAFLEERAFKGLYLSRIGDVTIQIDKLGEYGYLLELMQELEVKKSIRLENETTYYTINL